MNNFNCYYCHYINNSKIKLDKHFNTKKHSKNIKIKKIICEHCKFFFKNNEDLKIHSGSCTIRLKYIVDNVIPELKKEMNDISNRTHQMIDIFSYEYSDTCDKLKLENKKLLAIVDENNQQIEKIHEIISKPLNV